MKQFEFTVKEPLGIHARPAGMLTKEAKKYSSTITLKKGDKEQSIKRNYISLPVFVARSANLIPTIY